ncbi:glycosyltransferase [Cohnella panacarvi]|uniref:glycosyltransferase n=1 Tax=Cohnella panacarvi TaxID=400776 RepID=UPI0004AF32EA|nr:glycosyltransferase [Cohnella panacarvi]
MTLKTRRKRAAERRKPRRDRGKKLIRNRTTSRIGLRRRLQRLRRKQPIRRRRRHRRLNLLFVVHSFFPESYAGTEKFVLNQAKSLSAKGHRVKIVTYSNRNPELFTAAIGDVLYREYIHEGVPVLAYRHSRSDPAKTFDISNNDLLLFSQSVIRKEKPHLVHFGHPLRGMEFMQACIQLRTRYVVTLTDFWFLCPKNTLLRNDQALCAGPDNGRNCLIHCQIPDVEQRLQSHIPLLRSASRIVSPSTFLASVFRSHLPDMQVDVIHHGMNLENIRVNERSYQPGDSLTLFYGGTLVPHKGVHLILQAMSLIPSDRLKLRIYGSGPEEYVRKLEHAASLDGRVEMLGVYTANDIPNIYQQVDVAVIPSIWYENHPLALQEALASQVPAIATNVGGMAEKVIDGYNGLAFRIGDPSHLAERITELLDNPAMLNVFKANMKQTRFPAVEQEAAAYERIYYSIVQPRISRRARKQNP